MIKLCTPADYYALAKHNEAVSDSIKNTHDDWHVTIRYYAAIHWVNGFLIKKFPRQYVPAGHDSRDRFVAKNKNELYKPLRQLESESEKLRYKPPYWKEIKPLDINKLEADYQFLKTESNK